MPRFKAYHLNDAGQPEEFAGIEKITLTVKDTRLDVLFKRGYIFGRQFIDVSLINKPVNFEHLTMCYRILFCTEETPIAEVKKKLTPNIL